MSGRVSYLGGIVKDGLILDLDAGSIESKDKISKSGIGRRHSENTKKKISEKQNKKKVCQIDIKTNKIINVYNSIKEASIKLGCSRPNLSSCLNKKRLTVAGYKWEFLN